MFGIVAAMFAPGATVSFVEEVCCFWLAPVRCKLSRTRAYLFCWVATLILYACSRICILLTLDSSMFPCRFLMLGTTIALKLTFPVLVSDNKPQSRLATLTFAVEPIHADPERLQPFLLAHECYGTAVIVSSVELAYRTHVNKPYTRPKLRSTSVSRQNHPMHPGLTSR